MIVPVTLDAWISIIKSELTLEFPMDNSLTPLSYKPASRLVLIVVVVYVITLLENEKEPSLSVVVDRVC